MPRSSGARKLKEIPAQHGERTRKSDSIVLRGRTGSGVMLSVQRALWVVVWIGSAVGGCRATPASKPPSPPAAASARPSTTLDSPGAPADQQLVHSVAVSDSASCALLTDTSVWCWGRNDGDLDARYVTQLPLLGVTKLLGSGSRFVALTADGRLFYWGYQAMRPIKLRRDELVQVQLGPVIDVELTYRSLCALEAGGRISCWDDNGMPAAPVMIPDARSLAISTAMRCALLQSGSVSCWTDLLGPAVLPALSDVIELVGGGAEHCALKSNGAVSCWSGSGDDNRGPLQLARPATHLSATPNAICSFSAQDLPRCFPVYSGARQTDPIGQPHEIFKPSQRMTQLAIAAEHACAVVDGAAWCWGDDQFGKLGNTRPLSGGYQLVRVDLGDTASLQRVKNVGVGRRHHCAALDDGSVRCWGNNEYGQIGIPPSSDSLGPQPVPGLTDVASVAVNDETSCAVQKNGNLRCWGGLKFAATSVKQVGLGRGYGCWLTADAQVRCWGDNVGGVLGAGENGPQTEPTTVQIATGQALRGVVTLRVFPRHACAITSSSALYCWGVNDPFSQGRPYNSPDYLPLATPLPVLEGVRDVSERCLLTSTGELRCWGDVFPGGRAFSYEPVRVGRCGVTALAPGPGVYFADSDGWAYLDPHSARGPSGDQAVYVRFEGGLLQAVASGPGELCGIASGGRLACFRHDGPTLRPGLGVLGMSNGDPAAAAANCTIDPPPSSLPTFPRQPAARVIAQLANGVPHNPGPSTTSPGVELSPSQTARLLALVNDPRGYIESLGVCYDPYYYYRFYDQAGRELARLGIGPCVTVGGSGEIPAQHGERNWIEPSLEQGLYRLCRELGLSACRRATQPAHAPARAHTEEQGPAQER